VQDCPQRAGRSPREPPRSVTPATSHQPSRRAIRAAFVLAAFFSLLVATAPAASAAPSCGRQVVDDWWDDGRIDGTYADHCYDDAIESLPRDVRDYSSAQEDITRALQAKLRGEESPPATTDPTPDGEDATPPPPPSPPGDDPPPTGEPPTTIATPPVGESASSVPVPLLILAGLALLLVIGGSAGYLIRRFQNRQIPPPAV
jgi:hypothetical protein